MTSAYGAFANGGEWREAAADPPRRGPGGQGPVHAPRRQRRRRSAPTTAFLMTSMLADVIDSGTAWKARQLGFRLPAAGKTGTTNDYRDAWFVGYTPSLVAGVWVGFDTPKPILPGSAYAGDVAVPLWAEFMKAATAGDKPERLRARRAASSAVQICRLSGKRPAGGCDAVPVSLEDGGHERPVDDRHRVLRRAAPSPTSTARCTSARSLLRPARPAGSATSRDGRSRRSSAPPTARAAEAPAAARAGAADAGSAERGRRAGAGAEEARLLVARCSGVATGTRRRQAEERPREEARRSARRPAAPLGRADAVSRHRRPRAADPCSPAPCSAGSRAADAALRRPRRRGQVARRAARSPRRSTATALGRRRRLRHVPVVRSDRPRHPRRRR